MSVTFLPYVLKAGLGKVTDVDNLGLPIYLATVYVLLRETVLCCPEDIPRLWMYKPGYVPRGRRSGGDAGVRSRRTATSLTLTNTPVQALRRIGAIQYTECRRKHSHSQESLLSHAYEPARHVGDVTRSASNVMRCIKCHAPTVFRIATPTVSSVSQGEAHIPAGFSLAKAQRLSCRQIGHLPSPVRVLRLMRHLYLQPSMQCLRFMIEPAPSLPIPQAICLQIHHRLLSLQMRTNDHLRLSSQG